MKFAGIAYASDLVSYQFQRRQSVLICLTFLTIFNSCHFFLLELVGPAVLMLLTGTQYVTAIFSQDRRWMLLLLLFSVGAVLLTYSGPLSLLPWCGVVMDTFGSFQTSDRIMRLSFIACNSIWLLHNLLAWTPVAALMEAFRF